MSRAAHPHRRGQSLVELALTLPVLGILLIGTIDFARVYYAAMAVGQAARAGAAYGAQSVSTSGDFVIGAIPSNMDRCASGISTPNRTNAPSSSAIACRTSIPLSCTTDSTAAAHSFPWQGPVIAPVRRLTSSG